MNDGFAKKAPRLCALQEAVALDHGIRREIEYITISSITEQYRMPSMT